MSNRVRVYATTPAGHQYYGGMAYRQLEGQFNDLVSSGLAKKLTSDELKMPRWKRAKTMVKSMKGFNLRVWREPRKTDTKHSMFGAMLRKQMGGFYPKPKKKKKLYRSYSQIIAEARGAVATSPAGRMFSSSPNVTQRTREPRQPSLLGSMPEIPTAQTQAMPRNSAWSFDFPSYDTAPAPLDSVAPSTRPGWAGDPIDPEFADFSPEPEFIEEE